MTSADWVFRVDAGPGIGGGHVSRCVALADALARQGATSLFLSGSQGRAAAAALMAGRHPVHWLHDGETTSAAIAALPSPRLGLVIDSYESRSAGFSDWAECIVRIHDFPTVDLLPCDIVVDPTAGRRAEDWNLPQPSPRLLLGLTYALLPYSLLAYRPAVLKPASRQVKRVLIGFGMSDSRDATSLAMSAARQALPEARIDVLVGESFPHRAKVLELAALLGVTALVGVDDVGPILIEADLAIGAGGVSALERACLGIPSVIFSLAPRQDATVEALDAAGITMSAGRLDDLSDLRLAERIAAVAGSPVIRDQLARTAFRAVDGKGADRVAHQMLAAARHATETASTGRL